LIGAYFLYFIFKMTLWSIILENSVQFSLLYEKNISALEVTLNNAPPQLLSRLKQPYRRKHMVFRHGLLISFFKIKERTLLKSAKIQWPSNTFFSLFLDKMVDAACFLL